MPGATVPVSAETYGTSSTGRELTGAGGGGAGGLISLISGDAIHITGALLDARGGAGGLRSDVGTTFTCNVCNAGGAGGRGFIFLMDADGQISGLIPGTPGNYNSFATGVLTIRTTEVLLAKVESVAVEESPVARMLGFGTVTIHGTGGTPETFERIAHPHEFRRRVQVGIEALPR